MVLQYSVFAKKELAHDESIWSCSWRSYDPSQEPPATNDANSEENGGENKERAAYLVKPWPRSPWCRPLRPWRSDFV